MIEERRPPITPQLALRVAILGVGAFALFAIIFFRLWYLQVLDGDKYLAQARSNRVRVERIPAPRGAIVDRNRLTIVENRRATIVALDPQRLPSGYRDAILEWGRVESRRVARPKGRRGPQAAMPREPAELTGLFSRLSKVLAVSRRTIERRVVSSIIQVPYADVRIRTDVGDAVRNYIKEREDEYPGVKVDEVFLRRYPYGSLAAQVIGTIGEISPRELEQERFRGLRQGTVIGKEGLERSYDRFLRGRDGAYRILVNALGNRRGITTQRDPVPGRQVRLSLDLGLQQAAERALRAAGGGRPGGFVALNPETGEVHALGSHPSYDPRSLSRPISQERYDELFGESAGSPRYNRAVAGLYPTGSTFKPITALAGLATGQVTPQTVINDTGCIRVGRTEADIRCNAGKVPNGPVDLRKAMQVSSDVYFYQLGLDLNPQPGQPLQKWADVLGLGHRSGIDLPDELRGLIPDRRWRDRINRAEARCRQKTKRPCGIADGTNRPWTVGDEVNLAIGQGDLQATPLQMAVAYAAIANGGTLVRPHLGLEVLDEDGRLQQRIDPGAKRRVKIDPGWREAIMDGLKLAASAPGGTSTDVFKGWNHGAFPIFGKTGTAQRPGRPDDQSWYVAYAYDASRPHHKPIVIAATVEDAGFGAEAAAPAVRLMLAKWFGQESQAKLVRGRSATR